MKRSLQFLSGRINHVGKKVLTWYNDFAFHIGNRVCICRMPTALNYSIGPSLCLEMLGEQYTRIIFSLIFLKILWSFQKNKKDHHGVFFIFADKLTYYTSAHLVSSFLLFLLTLWSRTCNLSCCFYWWNFWILRHEEIFI